jgi:hypothetical protein
MKPLRFEIIECEQGPLNSLFAALRRNTAA